jgi:hypothetical protein
MIRAAREQAMREVRPLLVALVFLAIFWGVSAWWG